HKGLLFSTTKVREHKTYTAKNRSGQDRTLLIEHPFRPDFHLVSKDPPKERARDVYRFELKLPAGKTAKEEVTEERDLVQQVLLSNSDEQAIRYFLQTTILSDKVKAALQHAQEKKTRLAETQRELAQVEQQLKGITEDQTRLRANLKEMP